MFYHRDRRRRWGGARVLYKSYSRNRAFCAGVMVMVEKGDGGSFRGELGLRSLARFSLAHAYERAPGRLVQERAVGEVHLVEYFPPLVDRRRACAESNFGRRCRARLLDGVVLGMP